jgi:hypothetical protein
MGLWPHEIMTPVHTLGAATPRDYEAQQRQHIANGRARYPSLHWRDPWVSPDRVHAWIGGGRWIVTCTTVGCANAPATHPEWKVARCFECGAVYDNVIFPPNVDAIVDALLQRPVVATRSWCVDESVAQLLSENVAHGIGAR